MEKWICLTVLVFSTGCFSVLLMIFQTLRRLKDEVVITLIKQREWLRKKKLQEQEQEKGLEERIHVLEAQRRWDEGFENMLRYDGSPRRKDGDGL